MVYPVMQLQRVTSICLKCLECIFACLCPIGERDVWPKRIERRLLEIGFVEGARVKILHEGFLGRDPIVVSLDDTRVALRRREARAVMVRPDQA